MVHKDLCSCRTSSKGSDNQARCIPAEAAIPDWLTSISLHPVKPDADSVHSANIVLTPLSPTDGFWSPSEGAEVKTRVRKAVTAAETSSGSKCLVAAHSPDKTSFVEVVLYLLWISAEGEAQCFQRVKLLVAKEHVHARNQYRWVFRQIIHIYLPNDGTKYAGFS